jgi:hypothetical protein
MAKPKKANVDVKLKKSNSPPGFTWEIESSYKKNGKLEFNNDKHPGFDVHFELEDKDDTGFRFPDDPDRALAVTAFTEVEPPCPVQGATYGEFVPVSVEDENKRLIVYNVNKTRTNFKYTLFVTKNPHGKDPACEEIDPIGSNQNGPRYESSFGVLAMVAGAGVIGLLLAVTFNIFERS